MTLTCPICGNDRNFQVKTLQMHVVHLEDGRVEVSVPYHMFCGGVDTHTVKVILREGATKLAIRGESTMLYPGQAPFGGVRQYDKALLQPVRAAYKKHMDRIWQEVSVFRYR